MAITIIDFEAERLAREISKITGESLTDVIASSLRERLKRLRGDRHTKNSAQGVDDILRRLDALSTLDERTDDEILGYDSRGTPH
jgi:antitoxin VapB